MILFILKMIFLTTMWTMGWKVVTSEGMLLQNISLWAENKKGNNLIEAAILCQWCIPNFHGILFVWPLAFGIGIMPFEFHWSYVLSYPFCVAGSSLASGLIWGVYLTLNAKKEYLESASKYYDKAEEREHLEIKTMKENYYKSKK